VLQKQLTLPRVLNDQAKLLERFSSASYVAVYTMLCCLSDGLNLADDKRFENAHQDGKPSGTGLKLVYEPWKSKLKDVVDNKHTDTGTLTIVFCEQWGIEIEMPETKEWAFVAPREGHALINVADSLQALSGKKLYSCLHRVTQPADGFRRRYYIVYFLRPEEGSQL
jgi:isopenicillin N synthase-like dioxygenase